MSPAPQSDNEVLAKLLSNHLDEITPHGWSWRISVFEMIIMECVDDGGSIRIESPSIGEIEELLSRMK